MVDSLTSILPGAKDREHELVYVYFAFIVALMIIYTMIIYIVYEPTELVTLDEPFNRLITGDIPGLGPISGWRALHFISFYIAGFLFPSSLTLIFMIGVLWEVIETIMGNLTDYFVEDNSSLHSVPVIINENIMYRDNWITGSVEDIIFNTAGMFLGYGTRKIVDKTRQSVKMMPEYLI